MIALRSPNRRDAWFLGLAAAAWTGHGLAAIGPGAVVGAAVTMCGALVARSRKVALVAAFVAVGGVAGLLHAGHETAVRSAGLPEGDVVVIARALIDPVPSFGMLMVVGVPTHIRENSAWVPWDGPPVAIRYSGDVVDAGNHLVVSGTMRVAPGVVRRRSIAGRIDADSVVVHGPGTVLFRVGNAMRSRVRSVISLDSSRERALLAGFLIGDVSRVDPLDMEALRRSGLTHYVAVSGSNVALFLAAWWFVAGPLARGRWLRPLVGMAGLAVFVVVTRWEPSVVRASVMVGYILAGRLVGIPVDAWTALGLTITTLLVMTAGIAGSVGFQLSVAATIGVIAGAGIFGDRRPRPLWATLGAAVSAQVAVLPVVLVHFGSVPLLSPIANVLAAPAVTVATVTAGIGTISGAQALVDIGAGASRIVLDIAKMAGSWPQVGPAGVLVVGAVVGGLAVRQVRPVAMVLVVIGVGVFVTPPGPPDQPQIVVLDVGQGDAILLMGPGGETILVDGGPDVVALDAGLRRHGVRGIDLLVVTHGDADHVAGLDRLHERLTVGSVWIPDHPDSGFLLADLIDGLKVAGINVASVRSGVHVTVGAFTLDVVGPQRRYAADNNGSVAMIVEAGIRRAFIGGDVEAIAQREIGPVDVDVMVVPHHGSATTDLRWLDASTPTVAIVSVGTNTYGHPSQDVLDVLTAADVEVRRTDDSGDVVLRMDS